MTTPSPDAARSALREAWAEADRIADSYPELRMRVYAAADGVHLVALLYGPGDHVGRPFTVLQHAVWQPREVTDIAVVDWGRRALADWLGRQLLAPEH